MTQLALVASAYGLNTGASMRKILQYFVVFSLVSSGAHAAPWRPTMESDPPQLGAEAIAYQNRLEKAYIQDYSNSMCLNTRPSYQIKDSYTYKRYHKVNSDRKNDTARKDFECIHLADQPPRDEVRGFAQAGFALSDLYCRTFFRRLALHSNKRRFQHEVVNGVGTLASAILGLASAGSAATGAIGAGFGTADSIFTNYDATFVVEPDPSLLEQNVLRQQASVEAEYWKSFEKADPAQAVNYYDANKAIEQHAYFCTFYGMKATINASLQKDVVAPAKKSEIDITALTSGLAAYGNTLNDRTAEAAFAERLGKLMREVITYLATAKVDDKIESQLAELTIVLTSYQQGSKSDGDKKNVNAHIDAAIKALG